MTVSRSVLLRDLLLTLVTVVGSLAVLPGVIYFVGLKLFGIYAGGVRQLYLDTFTSLFTPAWSAWILALGPALALLVLRWLWRSNSHNTTPAVQPSRQEPSL